MREYPPMLHGTEQQQLSAIRDFLVRLVKSLDESAPGTAITSGSKISGAPTSESTQLLATVKNLLARVSAKEAEDVADIQDDIAGIILRLVSAEQAISILDLLKDAIENNMSIGSSPDSGVALGSTSSPTARRLSLPSSWSLSIGAEVLDETKLHNLLQLL